MKELIY